MRRRPSARAEPTKSPPSRRARPERTRLVERLRAMRPSGRIVLQLRPDSPELPELALEDGDRLYVPPRPTTVGVFGSVFNGGSYLYASSRTLDEYLAWPAVRPAAPTDERVRRPRQRQRRQRPARQGLVRQQARPGRSQCRAGRHRLRAGGDQQDHLRAGRQGLDADPLPVRPRDRRLAALRNYEHAQRSALVAPRGECETPSDARGGFVRDAGPLVEQLEAARLRPAGRWARRAGHHLPDRAYLHRERDVPAAAAAAELGGLGAGLARPAGRPGRRGRRLCARRPTSMWR